jgi:hypothetical protein
MRLCPCPQPSHQSGIVEVLRHLLEAELLVVVGADPLAGIERALLQRRIDVAAGKLLRHDAEPGEDRAGKAADPELEALEVVDRLELLAEPATICAPVLPAAKPTQL